MSEKLWSNILLIFNLCLAALAPLSVPLGLLTTVCIADILVGYGANYTIKKEEWKFGKAFRGILKLGLFCFVVVLIHLATYYLEEVAVAKVLVKYLTWVMLWFYLGNICTNAHKLFPTSKAITFLQEVLTAKTLGRLIAKVMNSFGVELNTIDWDEIDKTHTVQDGTIERTVTKTKVITTEATKIDTTNNNSEV